MSVKVPKMIRKGVGVSNDTDPTKTAILTVVDDTTTETSTIIVAKQTADRTLILPDEDGTIVTNVTTDELVKNTSEFITSEELVRYDGTTGTLIQGGTGITVQPSDIAKRVASSVSFKIRTGIAEGPTQSSPIEIYTGAANAGAKSGDIDLKTGASSYSTNTGNINLTTGTSTSGTRGSVTITSQKAELAGSAATPSTDNSIATKKYVDDQVAEVVEGASPGRDFISTATAHWTKETEEIATVRNDNTDSWAVSQLGGVGVTFTPTMSGEVEYIDVDIIRPAWTIIGDLYAELRPYPTGSLIATSEIVNSFDVPEDISDGRTRLYFDNALVTGSTKYAIRFQQTENEFASGEYIIYQSSDTSKSKWISKTSIEQSYSMGFNLQITASDYVLKHPGDMFLEKPGLSASDNKIPSAQFPVSIPQNKAAFIEPNTTTGGSDLTLQVDSFDNIPASAVILAHRASDDNLILCNLLLQPEEGAKIHRLPGVSGPASSLTNRIAVFSDSSGEKLVDVDNAILTESSTAVTLKTNEGAYLGTSKDLIFSSGDAFGGTPGNVILRAGSKDSGNRSSVVLHGNKILATSPYTPTESKSLTDKEYVDGLSKWKSFTRSTPITTPESILYPSDYLYDDLDTQIEYMYKFESDTDSKILVEESGNFRGITTNGQWGSSVNQVVLAPDGDLVFSGGNLFINASNNNTSITKVSPDGRIDWDFVARVGTHVNTPGLIISLLYPTDDYLYFGTSSTVTAAKFFGRFDWQGNFDYHFWANSEVSSASSLSSADSIKQIGDKIFVGGVFTNWGGVTGYNNLVVLNLDGTIDTSATTEISGSGKIKSTSYTVRVRTIEEDNNGKIWIGGRFDTYGGVTDRNCLIRLNSDYTIDSTYCSTYLDAHVGAGDEVYQIAVDSENNIFYSWNGDSDVPIAKFLDNAGQDTTFNTVIHDDNDLWNATIVKIQILSDDRILLAGNFNAYDASLVLLDTDGTKDTDFMSSVGLNEYEFQVSDVALAEDETIIYCVLGGDNVARDGMGRIVKMQLDKNIYNLHGILYLTEDKGGNVHVRDIHHSGNAYGGKLIFDTNTIKFVPRFSSENLTGTFKYRILK